MPSDLVAAVTAMGEVRRETAVGSESQGEVGVKGEDMVLPRRQSDRNTRISLSPSHWVAALVVAALAVTVWSLVTSLPMDAQRLRIPTDIEGLKQLREFLSDYSAAHEVPTMLCLSAVYISMQALALPGTIVLSILAGALFGMWKGLLLVTLTATTGASVSYLLSFLVGRPLAYWLWPERMQRFRQEINRQRGHLFYYMLFLRVTPLLPNTFINIASPIVHVPYSTFALATFVGLIPNSFLAVKAGLTLGNLQSLGNLYNKQSIAVMAAIAVVSVLPLLLGKKAKGA